MFFALSYLSYLILGKTFVDWKRVFVKAGNGGNGSISFVHSRYNTFLYILESLTFTSEYIVEFCVCSSCDVCLVKKFCICIIFAFSFSELSAIKLLDVSQYTGH